MAVAIGFFIFAVLMQFALTQQGTTIANPVAIPPDGTDTCPSQELENSVLRNISNDLRETLANYQLNSECGNGLWQRVAYLNMSNPQQQCPAAWRLYSTNGIRACGRPVTSQPSCPAVNYNTGRQYRRVCGRITGYQVATTGAFNPAHANPPPSGLDDIYVDGVSVTHGNPRSHIWTKLY